MPSTCPVVSSFLRWLSKLGKAPGPLFQIKFKVPTIQCGQGERPYQYQKWGLTPLLDSCQLRSLLGTIRKTPLLPDSHSLQHQAIEYSMANKIFISYSHKDKKFCDELLEHLKPFERADGIEAWSDKQIAPGSQWFSEIRDALNSAKIAVLLVTRSFLASEFIHKQELSPLLKQAEVGGVEILWIPVRACAYEKTPLAGYQALISPGKPLAEMKSERDTAWVRICKEIAARAANP